MADISDLPMLHDIDDYSPQHVRHARALRGKIESGQYRQGDMLPAADLAREYTVSIRVTYCAPAMLAANRYISRPEAATSCSATAEEVKRLAVIFGVSAWQLTTRCANCGGYPPAGFACLTCGARPQT
jgi:DNA-binding transcriptional MocR family regulator